MTVVPVTGPRIVIGAPSTLYSKVFAGSFSWMATLVPSKFAFRPIGPQLPTGLFGSVKSQRPKYWIPGGPPDPPLLLELAPDEPLLPEEPLPPDPLLVEPPLEPLLVEPPLVDPLVDALLAGPPLLELPLDDPPLVDPPFELLAPELLEEPPSSTPVPTEPSPLEQNANRQTDPAANTDFATISAVDWIMGTHLLLGLVRARSADGSPSSA
jgi:hypothetical protein